MVVLFDYDSLIYHSVYRIVTLSEIKELYQLGMIREEIESEIVLRCVERAGEMTLSVLDDIKECGIEITDVKYFLTTCSKSVRKQICDKYKAKRKGNKWVARVRAELRVKLGCICSDKWEADDLIADYAKGDDKYLICAIDKDLKQIEGYHYNYQKTYEGKGEDRVYTGRKGLSHTSKIESVCFLATQMLMGDSGDGIQGIKGIGIKRAEKILAECRNGYSYMRRIVEQYHKAFGEDARIELMKNYRLLKLGTI